MKTFKSTSKKGTKLFNDYIRSRNVTLTDCYKSISTSKAAAFIDCLNKFNDEQGVNFRIISYNTVRFTCGWITAEGLRVETKENSYLINIDDQLPF